MDWFDSPQMAPPSALEPFERGIKSRSLTSAKTGGKRKQTPDLPPRPPRLGVHSSTFARSPLMSPLLDSFCRIWAKLSVFSTENESSVSNDDAFSRKLLRNASVCCCSDHGSYVGRFQSPTPLRVCVCVLFPGYRHPRRDGAFAASQMCRADLLLPFAHLLRGSAHTCSLPQAAELRRCDASMQQLEGRNI